MSRINCPASHYRWGNPVSLVFVSQNLFNNVQVVQSGHLTQKYLIYKASAKTEAKKMHAERQEERSVNHSFKETETNKQKQLINIHLPQKERKPY